MVDLAAGGKDINAVLADVLDLLTKSSGVGTLLSIFGKMTLDVMQTPMKEFMKEGLERDKKELDTYKFLGKRDFTKVLNRYTFLKDIYKTKSVSYKTMQGLLSGNIKRWKDLEYANEEVTLLYKYIEKEDAFIIDIFFINIKKQ